MESSPRVCIERANRLLYQSTRSEKFVTLFYGVLDPDARTLSYSNAGHDNPFLFHQDEEPARLGVGGVVLSIMETFPYSEQTIPIGEGDLLVIYSDGIVEAINPDQEQFGQDRLAEVIRQHRDDSPGELIDSIINAVKVHAGTAAQMDDMTLVVVRGVPA